MGKWFSLFPPDRHILEEVNKPLASIILLLQAQRGPTFYQIRKHFGKKRSFFWPVKPLRQGPLDQVEVIQLLLRPLKTELAPTQKLLQDLKISSHRQLKMKNKLGRCGKISNISTSANRLKILPILFALKKTWSSCLMFFKWGLWSIHSLRFAKLDSIYI